MLVRTKPVRPNGAAVRPARAVTAVSAIALAGAASLVLAGSPARAADLWYSSLTYTGTGGAGGGFSSPGGNGQSLSETDQTNAADNPATPIPPGGGVSFTEPVLQSRIQPGDTVELSQTVYGGSGGGSLSYGGGFGGGATSQQDWTEPNAASTGIATTAYAGNGGDGGTGGGAGGNGTASSTVTVGGNLTSAGGLSVTAAGGSGGNGGSPSFKTGSGGDGGTATATASGTSTGAPGNVSVSASATGGAGGAGLPAPGGPASGGNGGAATVVSAYGSSASGNVNVSATQQGGAGGNGSGGAGGGSGASSTMTNLVSGSTTGSLSLVQESFAGAGGASDTGANGSGGTASSSLGTPTTAYTDTQATSFSATVQAQGGGAGDAINLYTTTPILSTGPTGIAGTGTAYLNAVATGVAPGNSATFAASATGGAGGASNSSPTNGADAASTVQFTTTGSSTAGSNSVATGGLGGAYDGSGSGSAANGGNANAAITGNFNGTGSGTSGLGKAYNQVEAVANAGQGGTAYNFYFPTSSGVGGNGGTSTVQAFAASSTGQNLSVIVNVNDEAGSGAGGEGGANGIGGNGANVLEVNRVAGSTTGELYLTQIANGGNGGISLNGTGGKGGNAESDLTYSDASSPSLAGYLQASNLQGFVEAFGGAGGAGGTTPGTGGNGTANIALTSGRSGALVAAEASAIGYGGGYITGSGLYGPSGSASASARATGVSANGVAGPASNSVYTSASSPALATSPYPYQSAIAIAATGTVSNTVFALGGRPGSSGSQAVIAPVSSVTSGNGALNTTAVMGAIESSTSTPYSFTEVATGSMQAEGSGSAASQTYRMSADFQLSAALIGTGNELLFGSGSANPYNPLLGTRELGSGFDSLSLTITDTNSSGVFDINEQFTTYAAFATFIAQGVDLGNDVSGAQDVDIMMSEMLTGTNGASMEYVLALAPFAQGGYTSQTVVAATPLPRSLPMFGSGVIGLGAFGWRKARRKLA